MKKTTARLIVITVSVLIVLNTVLIGLLWAKKGPAKQVDRRPLEEVNAFIIRELQLNEEQASAFIEISKEHRQAQAQNQEEFRRRKFDLNTRMMEGEVIDFDSAAAKLAEVTLNKEREFYRFFSETMAICNDEQKRQLQRVFFEATGPPEHGKTPFRKN